MFIKQLKPEETFIIDGVTIKNIGGKNCLIAILNPKSVSGNAPPQNEQQARAEKALNEVLVDDTDDCLGCQ